MKGISDLGLHDPCEGSEPSQGSRNFHVMSCFMYTTGPV